MENKQWKEMPSGTHIKVKNVEAKKNIQIRLSPSSFAQWKQTEWSDLKTLSFNISHL